MSNLLHQAVHRLAYGHIYVTHDDATPPTQEVQNSFELLTVWDANGVNKAATADQANNRIAVTNSGVYLVLFHMQFSGDTANDVWEFALYKGTIASTAIDNSMVVHRKIGTGGDVGSCFGVALVSLTAGQVVEIYVKNDSGTDHTLSCNNAGLIVVGLF